LTNYFKKYPETTKEIISVYDFHFKIYNLLTSENLNLDSESNINLIEDSLDFLLCLLCNIKNEDLKIFLKNIVLLSNIIKKGIQNLDCILKISLKIINRMTNNEEISRYIVTSGMGYDLQQLLTIENIKTDILTIVINIFENLFVDDNNIVYFINLNVLDVFKKILNNFINSNNKNISNKILKNCIIALSNISSGNIFIKKKLLENSICNNIINIMKIKKDNDIYYNGVNFFLNLIEDSDEVIFNITANLKIFKLFCDGLSFSNNNDNIILCLLGIKICLEMCFQINKNIKLFIDDYNNSEANKKIEDFIYDKNEEISEISDNIYMIIYNSNEI